MSANVYSRIRSACSARRAMAVHRSVKQAAILVGLATSKVDDSIHVLLTCRTSTLRQHAGEVAFPGGKVDASDRSVVEAAIREAHEEVGLQKSRMRVLGSLPPMISKHKLVVTPVIAELFDSVEDLRVKNCAGEVADAFVVPLSFFLENGPWHAHRDFLRATIVPPQGSAVHPKDRSSHTNGTTAEEIDDAAEIRVPTTAAVSSRYHWFLWPPPGASTARRVFSDLPWAPELTNGAYPWPQDDDNAGDEVASSAPARVVSLTTGISIGSAQDPFMIWGLTAAVAVQTAAVAYGPESFDYVPTAPEMVMDDAGFIEQQSFVSAKL